MLLWLKPSRYCSLSLCHRLINNASVSHQCNTRSLSHYVHRTTVMCGEHTAFRSERRPEGFCDCSCMNGDIFSLYNLILQLKLVPRVLDSLNPIMNNLHAHNLKNQLHTSMTFLMWSFLRFRPMYELCSFVPLCNFYYMFCLNDLHVE